MKRLLVLLLLISSLLALVSCNTLEGLMKDLGIEYGDTVEKDEDEKIPVHPNTDKNDESEKPEENGGNTEGGDNTENGGNTEGGDDGEDTAHTYKSFTAAEKELMSSVIGFVIPFIPNDEYYVEEYTDEEYGEHGINFYSFDNTKAEFDAYLETISDTYDAAVNPKTSNLKFSLLITDLTTNLATICPKILVTTFHPFPNGLAFHSCHLCQYGNQKLAHGINLTFLSQCLDIVVLNVKTDTLTIQHFDNFQHLESITTQAR